MRRGRDQPTGTSWCASSSNRTIGRGPTTPSGRIEFIDGRVVRDVTHLSLARARRLVAHTSSFGRPLIERPLAVRQEYLGRALGRSLAHEIGHYLLSARDHRDRGLTRRTLTRDDISTQALGDTGPVMPSIHSGC